MFDELLIERAAAPGDDLVSALVAEQGETLSGEELAALVRLLLIAGFETTVNAIGNGVRWLLEDPVQWQTLVDDPTRAAQVAEEVLRFDPPVQQTGRVAHAEIEVGGVTMRRNQWVLTLLAAANRDPDVYPRPQPLRHRSGGAGRASGVLRRNPLLPRLAAGPDGAHSRVPGPGRTLSPDEAQRADRDAGRPNPSRATAVPSRDSLNGALTIGAVIQPTRLGKSTSSGNYFVYGINDVIAPCRTRSHGEDTELVGGICECGRDTRVAAAWDNARPVGRLDPERPIAGGTPVRARGCRMRQRQHPDRTATTSGIQHDCGDTAGHLHHRHEGPGPSAVRRLGRRRGVERLE